MIVLPMLTPAAKPVAPIVATVVAEELHVAELVRFCLPQWLALA
jgi:hypothetical protein